MHNTHAHRQIDTQTTTRSMLNLRCSICCGFVVGLQLVCAGCSAADRISINITRRAVRLHAMQPKTEDMAALGW